MKKVIFVVAVALVTIGAVIASGAKEVYTLRSLGGDYETKFTYNAWTDELEKVEHVYDDGRIEAIDLAIFGETN